MCKCFLTGQGVYERREFRFTEEEIKGLMKDWGCVRSRVMNFESKQMNKISEYQRGKPFAWSDLLTFDPTK